MIPFDRVPGATVAKTTYSSPTPPFEIQLFWPRSTYPSSVRVAVVVMDAASDPAPGSVVASALIGGLSPAIGSIQRRFWSSLPSSRTGLAKKPPEVIRLPIPAQPQDSSSWTMQPVSRSVRPPPPNSSGSMNEVRPREAALYQTSQGVSTSASSTAREIGRISFCANSRQTAWISRCSGVNSMMAPATTPILPDRPYRAVGVASSVPTGGAVSAPRIAVVGRGPGGEGRVVELDGHPFFVGTLLPQARSTSADPIPCLRSWSQVAHRRPGEPPRAARLRSGA